MFFLNVALYYVHGCYVFSMFIVCFRYFILFYYMFYFIISCFVLYYLLSYYVLDVLYKYIVAWKSRKAEKVKWNTHTHTHTSTLFLYAFIIVHHKTNIHLQPAISETFTDPSSNTPKKTPEIIGSSGGLCAVFLWKRQILIATIQQHPWNDLIDVFAINGSVCVFAMSLVTCDW